MYAGQFVFTQLMDHLPWHVFRRCVMRYDGDRKVKSFSCLDQFRCLAFAQLTWRKVCETSKPACGRNLQSFIISVSVASKSRATQWQTPMPNGIGASMQTLRSIRSAWHESFIPMRFCPVLKGWIPFTRWNLRRLTYACRCSRGLRSARPRPRSSCTLFRSARQHPFVHF